MGKPVVVYTIDSFDIVRKALEEGKQLQVYLWPDPIPVLPSDKLLKLTIQIEEITDSPNQTKAFRKRLTEN